MSSSSSSARSPGPRPQYVRPSATSVSSRRRSWTELSVHLDLCAAIKWYIRQDPEWGRDAFQNLEEVFEDSGHSELSSGDLEALFKMDEALVVIMFDSLPDVKMAGRRIQDIMDQVPDVKHRETTERLLVLMENWKTVQP